MSTSRGVFHVVPGSTLVNHGRFRVGAPWKQKLLASFVPFNANLLGGLAIVTLR